MEDTNDKPVFREGKLALLLLLGKGELNEEICYISHYLYINNSKCPYVRQGGIPIAENGRCYHDCDRSRTRREK